MAKKKSHLPAESRDSQPVQRVQPTLDPDLAKDVRALCGFLGISVNDWINSRLAPIVSSELVQELARRGFKPDPK